MLKVVRAFVGRFYTGDAWSAWNELGQTFVVGLFTSSSLKTATRWVMRLDEPSPLVQLGRITSVDGLSRYIICDGLLPVFILHKVNRHTTDVCLSWSQMDYASLL